MTDMFHTERRESVARDGPRAPAFKAPLLASLYNTRLAAFDALPRVKLIEEIAAISADIAVLVAHGYADPAEAGQVLSPMRLVRAVGEPLRTAENEAIQARIDAGRGRSLADVFPRPEEGLYHRDEFRPTFPVDVIPSPFKDFANRTAEDSGLSLDYLSVSLIASAAAAMGRVRTVTTVRGTGFEQPPIFWFGLIGRSSQAKSPALGFAKRMLEAVEASRADDNEARLREWKTAKTAASAARKRWEREVEKATEEGLPAPTMPAEAEDPMPYQAEVIMIDDATPEAVLQICAGIPRGVILFRDELPGWWEGFNRYSGGGGEREFWLEAHDGGSKRASRVKFGGSILKADSLSVSIIGGAQPAKLKSFLDGPSDGLVERFLWAWPEYHGTETPTQPVYTGPCIEALKRLRGLQFIDVAGSLRPRVVPLSGAALSTMIDFKARSNAWAEIAPEGEDGSVGKADKQVLRLALVLEYMAWSGHGGEEPSEVGAVALNAAIYLWEHYFLHHLRLVLNGGGAKSSSPAIALAKWIADNEVGEFTRTQVCRNANAKDLRDSATVQKAIDELLGSDWVFPNFSRAGGGKGRPKQAYVVNPNIHLKRFRSYFHEAICAI